MIHFPVNIYSIRDVVEWRKSFFWPISQKEIYEIELICAEALISEIRKYNTYEKRLLRIAVGLMYSQFNDWCSAAIAAQRLSEKSTKDIINLDFSNERKPNSININPINSLHEIYHKRPPADHYVENIRYHSYRTFKSQKILDQARIMSSYLKMQSKDCIKGLIKKSDNYGVHANGYTINYLRFTQSVFSHLNVHMLFKPVLRINSYQIDKYVKISKNLCSIVEAIYLRFTNEQMDSHLSEFFILTIAKFLYIIDFDIKIIMQQKRKLADKHLFTGTGGNYFTRVLSIATRELNGMVTGFPHGGGSQSIHFPKFAFSEFETPNEFVCYDKSEIEESKKYKTIDNNIHFVYKPGLEKSAMKVEHLLDDKTRLDFSKIKTIMYICAGFHTDRHGSQVIPETVQFEFELYLIEYFLSLGKKVIYKRYPKSIYMENSNFDLFGYFKNKNIMFESRWFRNKEIFKNVDLLAYSKAASTALYEGMTLVDIPMVLFHMDIPKLNESFKNQIRKRGFLIDLYQDDRNRLRFHKQDFENIFQN